MRIPSGFGGNDAHDMAGVQQWIAAHWVWIVVIAVTVLTFVVALTALVLWVNSRGTFMYIDNVATARAEVSRPWHAHAALADSYFVWRFALGLTLLVVFIVLIGGGLAGIVTLASAPPPLPMTIALVAVWVLSLLGLVITAVLASMALRDFVAPLQLHAGVPCGTAVRSFLVLLHREPGAFALYVFMKFVFSMVFGVLALVVACATCCCALIPIVSQTLLQPVLFFERAWSLYLLRDMGHDLFGEKLG